MTLLSSVCRCWCIFWGKDIPRNRLEARSRSLAWTAVLGWNYPGAWRFDLTKWFAVGLQKYGDGSVLAFLRAFSFCPPPPNPDESGEIIGQMGVALYWPGTLHVKHHEAILVTPQYHHANVLSGKSHFIHHYVDILQLFVLCNVCLRWAQ